MLLSVLLLNATTPDSAMATCNSDPRMEFSDRSLSYEAFLNEADQAFNQQERCHIFGSLAFKEKYCIGELGNNTVKFLVRDAIDKNGQARFVYLAMNPAMIRGFSENPERETLMDEYARLLNAYYNASNVEDQYAIFQKLNRLEYEQKTHPFLCVLTRNQRCGYLLDFTLVNSHIYGDLSDNDTFRENKKYVCRSGPVSAELFSGFLLNRYYTTAQVGNSAKDREFTTFSSKGVYAGLYSLQLLLEVQKRNVGRQIKFLEIGGGCGRHMDQLTFLIDYTLANAPDYVDKTGLEALKRNASFYMLEAGYGSLRVTQAYRFREKVQHITDITQLELEEDTVCMIYNHELWEALPCFVGDDKNEMMVAYDRESDCFKTLTRPHDRPGMFNGRSIASEVFYHSILQYVMNAKCPFYMSNSDYFKMNGGDEVLELDHKIGIRGSHLDERGEHKKISCLEIVVNTPYSDYTYDPPHESFMRIAAEFGLYPFYVGALDFFKHITSPFATGSVNLSNGFHTVFVTSDVLFPPILKTAMPNDVVMKVLRALCAEEDIGDFFNLLFNTGGGKPQLYIDVIRRFEDLIQKEPEEDALKAAVFIANKGMQNNEVSVRKASVDFLDRLFRIPSVLKSKSMVQDIWDIEAFSEEAKELFMELLNYLADSKLLNQEEYLGVSSYLVNKGIKNDDYHVRDLTIDFLLKNPSFAKSANLEFWKNVNNFKEELEQKTPEEIHEILIEDALTAITLAMLSSLAKDAADIFYRLFQKTHGERQQTVLGKILEYFDWNTTIQNIDHDDRIELCTEISKLFKPIALGFIENMNWKQTNELHLKISMHVCDRIIRSCGTDDTAILSVAQDILNQTSGGIRLQFCQDLLDARREYEFETTSLIEDPLFDNASTIIAENQE